VICGQAGYKREGGVAYHVSHYTHHSENKIKIRTGDSGKLIWIWEQTLNEIMKSQRFEKFTGLKM